MGEERAAGIGVYVHIPYCIKKCPYCDFNSYSVSSVDSSGGAFDERGYTDALLAELQFRADQGWRGRALETVFFGGGTPSLFDPTSIRTILDAIFSCFSPLSPEVTLEANPGTIQETLGRSKLEGFLSAGINRVSMGCQSFSAKKLRALGRIHSPEESRAAVENIRAAGFENFNLDLMFGVEGELVEEWERDLDEAIALEPTHISAYGLTIEPGTEFSRLHRKGLLPVPSEDRQAEMYRLTQERLGRWGARQYEISNYALPGFECRHNLGYWSGRAYLGLGAGAHSFLPESAEGRFGRRWSNIPKPSHYIERALERGDASQRTDPLDEQKAEVEFFYLGLRRDIGVDTAAYERRFGRSLPEAVRQEVDALVRENLLAREGTRLRLTREGFLYADHVLARLC